jgi:hypothetical protein
MSLGVDPRRCGVRATAALVALLLAVPSTSHADPTQLGRVGVAHDVNTLSTSMAGAQEARFATNVARFLTANRPTKNLLLFLAGTDGARDYATIVQQALRDSGYTVTVTQDYATAYAGYDAVFVGLKNATFTGLDNAALVDYVLAGGGVYLFGGVDMNAAGEAAVWATFLGTWGLSFGSPYNGYYSVPITETHPIFAGVTTLKCGLGSPIRAGTLAPNANIIQTTAQGGVYAVVEASADVGVAPNAAGEAPMELAVGPCPASGTVRIAFTLPRACAIDAGVYDVDGRCVASLARGVRYAPGRHELAWDARGGTRDALPCGMYFVRVSGADGVRTRAVVTVR